MRYAPFLLSLLLFFGIFLTEQVYAQAGSVSGVVRDDQGAPLPGVNVVIEGTTKGDAANTEGRYHIREVTSGSYTLVATAVGYQSERIAIAIAAGEDLVVDFVLQETALIADEVVVTASRRAQRFSQVPVSLSVMPSRELEERNIVTLDQALRYVPGVQMADNQINIRGSSGFSFNTGSRVLLLLDGMPLVAPDRESIPFEALPMAQVERIEVVKGPGSALYGSGALGGVINVITKDYPASPETFIRAYGGVYEPARYAVWREQWDKGDTPQPLGGITLTHAQQINANWGFWGTASYRIDEGHTNFRRENTLDTFFKVGWKKQNSLRFDLLMGWTRRKSDGFLYWNGLRDALNPGQLTFGGIEATGANDNLINQYHVLPSFSHVLSSRLYYTIKARAFGLTIQPLEDDGSPKPISSGTAGIRYGGEAQVNWTPGSGQFVTAGVSADALATESSFFQPDNEEAILRSQPEAAVFVQAEQRLFQRVDAVVGLRFDSYKIDAGDVERKLSPKLNLSLPLVSSTVLRAAYGQGFRVPSVAERFVNDQSFLPLIPNLDLRPEESASIEVGTRSQTSFSRVIAQLDLALFWTHYDGLIEPKFIPEKEAFQFVNLTEARIRGLEAVIDAATRNNRWRASIGYTFLDARDLTEDTPLVFRSRHQLKTSLVAPIWGPLSLGLDYRYATKPERVDSDFSRFVRDAESIVPINVLDARIRAEWNQLSFALLLNNALEYYYVERPAILAPTRHILLQVQASF